MNKLTKKQQELLKELITEYVLGLDDTNRDEWYGTRRGFASGTLSNFLNWLGIDVPEEIKS